MPELPEVETTCRGIAPHITGEKIKSVTIREHRLRWPIPKNLPGIINNLIVTHVNRRGKYLLLTLGNTADIGTLIIHLGMSGSLRICSHTTHVEKHDHIDFMFENNKILRLKDPRKFGCVLWTDKPVNEHKLLVNLGPEPINDNSMDNEFDGDYLYRTSRKRTCSIKAFIMNSSIVVGVGNIYASESLFLAGINPTRKAGSISLKRYKNLANAIKQVLSEAIKQGGTTLRDFTRENGQPGYFAQKLLVYGRAGQPCENCRRKISQITQQQRSSYYCKQCQK